MTETQIRKLIAEYLLHSIGADPDDLGIGTVDEAFFYFRDRKPDSAHIIDELQDFLKWATEHGWLVTETKWTSAAGGI